MDDSIMSGLFVSSMEPLRRNYMCAPGSVPLRCICPPHLGAPRHAALASSPSTGTTNGRGATAPPAPTAGLVQFQRPKEAGEAMAAMQGAVVRAGFVLTIELRDHRPLHALMAAAAAVEARRRPKAGAWHDVSS
jgi:hypothetical protein